MTVSIIIPCLNEKNYIAKCLDSIVHCTYPTNNLSIYVCDGMSTDGTRDIISQYSQKYNFIHLLDNPKKTTPFALNIGLKESKAEIKIILGAHSEIYPDFIDQCLLAFKNDPAIGCVGGIIENEFDDATSEAISCAMSSVFGVGSAHFRTGTKEGFVDTVAFGAYKQVVFDTIGYFDEELVRNQDDEFNYRVIKHGFKIYLSRSIRSKYYVRARFKKLFKQYYQYGYWKVYVNTKHKTVTTTRQIIPALFVSYIIFCFFTLLIKPLLGFYLSLVFLLYTGLATFSAWRIASNLGKIPLIVYSFFILHLSYGIGYIEGVFNFLIIRKKPSKRYKKSSR